MSAVNVLTTTLFGGQQLASVKRCPRNWVVSWDGMTVVTSVPRSMAVCAQEAAHKAAAFIEAKPWGSFLAARIREIRVHEGALSSETAAWVVAKSEGKPYERHGLRKPGETMEKALARIEARA